MNRSFGETVPGYSIPVLNEREIRAAAGLLFLAMTISVAILFCSQNFSPLRYNIILFTLDFFIRVFISPRYAPTLILGRLIVSRQNPEYVGAAQKKVAWIIGFVLAVIMFVLMVVLYSYSIISGIICLICLVFLFFESSFGICLGCLFYKWIYKEKAQYCPGEVCDIKTRHEIQKISFKHILIVLVTAAVMVAIGLLFNDYLSLEGRDLFKAF